MDHLTKASVTVSWRSCTRQVDKSPWAVHVDAEAPRRYRYCRRHSDPPQSYQRNPSPNECSHPVCHSGTDKHYTTADNYHHTNVIHGPRIKGIKAMSLHYRLLTWNNILFIWKLGKPRTMPRPLALTDITVNTQKNNHDTKGHPFCHSANSSNVKHHSIEISWASAPL